jgi:hypothetical protein
MDTTLVTVTILSMGMAAALSVIVWRLLRDERHRSEARIAALTEASRPGPSSALRAAEDKPLTRAIPAAAHASPAKAGSDKPEVAKAEVAKPEASRPGVFKPEVFKPVASRPVVSDPVVSVSRRNSADDLPLHVSGAPAMATGALFVEPVRTSPWGNRFAVMAGLAMIVAAIVLGALTSAKSPAAAPAQNAAAAPAAQAAAEPAAAGLELLALRDARREDTLTITGMVQNPREGTLHSRVAVTAYAFDDKGQFLASGRALLDVTSLAPGDESPFMVTVPVTGAVARYRIGFRTEDGRVIAHVDKRQQAPMAALRQPNG